MHNGLVLKGLTFNQIRDLMTDSAYDSFSEWMRGQTVGVDPKTREGVVYGWDLERWLVVTLRTGEFRRLQTLSEWD